MIQARVASLCSRQRQWKNPDRMRGIHADLGRLSGSWYSGRQEGSREPASDVLRSNRRKIEFISELFIPNHELTSRKFATV
jgi:hypothetical protein